MRKSVCSMTSKELFASMSETQKDEIYRMVWHEHVVQDVKQLLDENEDIASLVTGDISHKVADAYVYHRRYDCNRSYWENLETLIRECC